MKTVVITGAAGLLGSHFSRYLLSNGYRVIGIDDLSGGYSDYLPKDVDSSLYEFNKFNLSTKDAAKRLEEIFSREKPVACYHFAAYAAEGLSPFIRHFNYTNNVLSSANIINACINHDCKLIFTSSMAVYGDQKAPFMESMVPSPIDPYGIAKYAVEMDIRTAQSQHGLAATIVRPHNVIGIYQNIWDRYRNVAGIFIRRAIQGKPIIIYGDGEQVRAFSDIKYYMEPFYKLMTKCSGHTFNIGADHYWTIKELANVVRDIATDYGYSVDIEYGEPRHEVKNAYCCHDKAKDPRNLGFEDNTNLVDLIDEMFGWAVWQPERVQKDMEYEVKKGIYDYWK